MSILGSDGLRIYFRMNAGSTGKGVYLTKEAFKKRVEQLQMLEDDIIAKFLELRDAGADPRETAIAITNVQTGINWMTRACRSAVKES